MSLPEFSDTDFVAGLRAQTPPADIGKPVLGAYSAKKVTACIEEMQMRMRNMETAYQERFEQLRTSLLAAGRERDTLQARVHELEEERALVPVDSHTQTGILVNADQYEKLLADADHYEQNMQQALQREAELTDRLDQMRQRLDQAQLDLQRAQQSAARLPHAEEEAQASALQCRQLSEQLSNQRRLATSQQSALEGAQARIDTLNAQLTQAGAEYRALEAQLALARQSVEQLVLAQRTREQEFEAARRRAEQQRAAMAERYQELLRAQLQCMQRLQGGFEAAMEHMQALCDMGCAPLPESPTGLPDELADLPDEPAAQPDEPAAQPDEPADQSDESVDQSDESVDQPQ